MKPRIFISSTFYDLKYMREDISNFVRAHDFDPIMFEDGDIGYTPGKNLDESCYDTMKSADMVILIVGGNYGSPATGERVDSFKEYLSVTRKEFKTAADEGIPIYVFVDSDVYVEYGIYESNIKNIEEQKINISFKMTKDLNVFRFIKEIHALGKISVIAFRKSSDIKDFLSKQWSDMFKNYLQTLKEDKNAKHIYDAMNNLQSLIRQMGVMVDGLGKKVIGNESEITYDKLLQQQIEIQAGEFAEKICNSFTFEVLVKSEENVEKAYCIIKNALIAFRKRYENVDVIGQANIFELLDSGMFDIYGVEMIMVNSSFFENWKENIIICDNQELSEKTLEILKKAVYLNRLLYC